MSPKLKGSLLLLLTAVVWGASFVSQSKGLDHMQPFSFNGLRSVIGGISLLPVIAFLRHGKTDAPPLKNSVFAGVCCGTVLFIASSIQQHAIQYTTAGKAGFITALYIIIVPILQLLLRQRPPGQIWICAATAIAGFWFLSVKEGFTVGRGDLLMLCCAVFFAMHIIVIDRFNGKNTDPIVMSCTQFFTVGLLSAPFAFLTEQPSLSAAAQSWLPLLYSGAAACGVAYTLQIVGQKTTPPAAATLIMSLESVFAVLFGWILLGEQLSLRELIGCGLVFAAVIGAQIEIPGRKANEDTVHT